MAVTTTKNPSSDRLLSFFLTGRDISTNQATAKFGIAPGTFRSQVAQLRKRGYSIYKNDITTSNGQSMQVYRLGTPTKRVVAAGYVALALAKGGDEIVASRLRKVGVIK